MRRGDVYWVAFDPSIGGEIRKTRPAVILTRDIAIGRINRLVVVPTTTAKPEVVRSIEAAVSFGGRTSKALADQITTVARERVLDRIGGLSGPDIRAVEDAVRIHLGLPRYAQ